MNNEFDELAKSLAQSVTRRQAFKKFGVGVAGMVLATVGLSSQERGGGYCTLSVDLNGNYYTDGGCINGKCNSCISSASCSGVMPAVEVAFGACGGFPFAYDKARKCSC